MVQILLTLLFSVVIFKVMWGPLGGRVWVKELLRDEGDELRRELAEAEDRLAEVENDPHPDETTETLRAHYESETSRLRRRLARLS